MMGILKTALFVLTILLHVTRFAENFVPEGSRILTRTSNGVYRNGKVTNSEGLKFSVTLDNGDQIECSYEDKTVVVPDSAPAYVTLGDHVIAVSSLANESQQYLTGFVTRVFCTNENELYEVTLDNNHRGNYTLGQLRKLPFFRSAHEDVQLDHFGSISHQVSDERAIVLDIIPSYSHVHATQRVIGYFPGYTSYIPGVVVKRNGACWQGAYHVKFDTGDERQQNFNEIRIIPPYIQFVL